MCVKCVLIKVALSLSLCFLLLFQGLSQNAPVVEVESLISYQELIEVDVTVDDFTDIGSFNLQLNYDPLVLQAIEVVKGAQLSGYFSSGVATPGQVLISWFTYPYLNLPNGTVLFTIKFSRVSVGRSNLVWFDDGFSCAWSNSSFQYLNDIPTEDYYHNGYIYALTYDAPKTICPPTVFTQPNEDISIPVYVKDFYNIGQIDLSLQFDPLVVTYNGFDNSSGYPNLSALNTVPGSLFISGNIQTGDSGIFYEDSTILFKLNFTHLGGSTDLSWNDITNSVCQYQNNLFEDLIDSPFENFYVDGKIAEKLSISIKVFLEGPFQLNIMNTSLSKADLLPTEQPYSTAPWNYGGSETLNPTVENIVDWVLIELRDATDAASADESTIVAKRAAFVNESGAIIDTNGIDRIYFDVILSNELYIVVRHRNHLDIMSAFPATAINNEFNYDFSLSVNQAYGTDSQRLLSAGIFGMYAGDANADGIIDLIDIINVWSVEAGTKGYKQSDFNFDKQVNTLDKNDYQYFNLNQSSQIPE